MDFAGQGGVQELIKQLLHTRSSIQNGEKAGACPIKLCWLQVMTSAWAHEALPAYWYDLGDASTGMASNCRHIQLLADVFDEILPSKLYATTLQGAACPVGEDHVRACFLHIGNSHNGP